MTEEKNKIKRAINILGIDQIPGVGTGLFLRTGHFLPGSPGLVRGAILMQGKDFLLGADLTAGPILETGILVIVHETTALDHHLVRGVSTALGIDKGTVLLPTDPVVTHQLEVVRLEMVVMHVPGATHPGPNGLYVCVTGAHTRQAAVPSTHFGMAHRALSVIFYIRPNLTEIGAILEIAIVAVTKIIGSYTAYQTIDIVTRKAIGHSLKMCTNQRQIIFLEQKISWGISL